MVHHPTDGQHRRAVRQPARPPVRHARADSAGAVGDIVTRHASAGGVREDRRTAHALRHTFCTMLAERGVALEVIRALAGHVDIRTTQIYVDVTDQRKAAGIGALERTRHPLAA
jgi:site-specific recombinase XerD